MSRFPLPANILITRAKRRFLSATNATHTASSGRGHRAMSAKEKKSYHKKATGRALETVNAHSEASDLRLYGGCFWYVSLPLTLTMAPKNFVAENPMMTSRNHWTDFSRARKKSPFVQRVWISLEKKKLPYQYIEVDPYAKPPSLVEISPKGLIPALRHGPTWSCHESTVIMEYVWSPSPSRAVLPRPPLFSSPPDARLTLSPHSSRTSTPAPRSSRAAPRRARTPASGPTT